MLVFITIFIISHQIQTFWNFILVIKTSLLQVFFSNKWKPSTVTQVFIDLFSNSSGYEDKENMFYFLDANLQLDLEGEWTTSQ